MEKKEKQKSQPGIFNEFLKTAQQAMVLASTCLTIINAGNIQQHKISPTMEAWQNKLEMKTNKPALPTPDEGQKLREDVTFGIAELEQHQLEIMNAIDGGTLTLNPDQQLELENNIEQLNAEIIKLKELEKRLQASQEAIVLLDNDDKLAELAEQGAVMALENCPEASPEDIQTFNNNINDYLFLINHSLILGKPYLLDEALNEQDKIRLAPLPPSVFVTAFRSIRDFIENEKVPNIISKNAFTELTAYLEYLIDVLPNRIN